MLSPRGVCCSSNASTLVIAVRNRALHRQDAVKFTEDLRAGHDIGEVFVHELPHTQGFRFVLRVKVDPQKGILNLSRCRPNHPHGLAFADVLQTAF